ncbi:MAG: ATP synthase F1 subunit delta [bacterium]|jgi:F-type H+-transporting ATPase subunit delta
MKDRRVAKRYAVALFELALELGKVEEIDAQCLQLEEVFADKALQRFFSQPQIRMSDKRAFLEKVFRQSVHPAVFRTLELLLEKGRMGVAEIVFDYFDILTDRFRGIEEVRLVTAVEADQDYVDRLVAKLRKFTKYPDLRVRTEVDSGIIGGAKVYLGRHTVIDGTIASRLKQMHEALLIYQH